MPSKGKDHKYFLCQEMAPDSTGAMAVSIVSIILAVATCTLIIVLMVARPRRRQRLSLEEQSPGGFSE